MKAVLSGVSFISRYMSVSTAPGSTALTRDVLRAELGGQRLGQSDQAGLARGIGGNAGESEVWPTKVEVKITEPPPCLTISAI